MTPLVFQRALICFHSSVIGFEARCRLFLEFNGYHLNGLYRGTLLSAIGVYANLLFYPLAFAIVETENKDSWKWVFTQLKGLFPANVM